MDDMYTTPLSWLIQAGRGPNQAATIDYLRSNAPTSGYLIKPVELLRTRLFRRYFTFKIVMHRLSDTAPTSLLKMPAIP
ncbi:hypothetical protein N7475_007729 [Penicillium sp. IBT 31633x]|nr:hypothetical protein N7475_007729 [Penicillium sp. IBT 31633x]